MRLNGLILAAVVFTASLGSGAWAGCKEDISKIDEALIKKDWPADVKAQAEDMRNQAVQLCGAGNEEDGLAVTAEAKVLLNIE